MKKIVLCVLVIMFTMLSANAMDIVRYNNAGAPISVSRNLSRPIGITHFPRCTRVYMGSGMAHPAGPARPIYPPRYRYSNGYRRPPRPPRMVNPYIMPPMHPATEISRLNKNYTVNVPRRSHTINGVTYYD